MGMEPHNPKNLPVEGINWEKHISLIGKANAEVARFDGLLQSMPDPAILLSPLSTQEAVLSSKIEGTMATLEEVLEFEADPNKISKKYEDIQEIINYRKAMSYAVKELEKTPLCLRMFKEVHARLLDNARGKNKNPGHFRTIQNWIGKPGTPVERASYIPPAPEKIIEALSGLENYINSDDKDFLVQLAIVHAQFELIHPFLDGNGRIGRMLMPLFLYYKKVLSSPMFYLSAYFEADREKYYGKLLSLSQEEDWDGWIHYFLTAVISQSKVNINKAKEIHKLYDTKKIKIAELTRSRYSIQALDFLFCMPIFKSSDFKEKTSIPRASIIRILEQLVRGGVITIIKKGSGRSGHLYLFKKLIDIVD